MNKRIFLIEDDSAIIEIYTMLLEKSHFTVTVFSVGKDAIEALHDTIADETKRPDVVLLDLTLPDIDGKEVLKEIKTSDALKDIKVFILTNQSDVTFEDVQPDKVLIKAHMTPSDLIEILKKELN